MKKQYKMSGYLKNKFINFSLFIFFCLLVQLINFCFIFKNPFPVFIYLDFFIFIALGIPIFFFKKTLFEMIYMPIIFGWLTLIYAINSCYYKFFGNVVSLRDILLFIGLANVVMGANTNAICWLYIIVDFLTFGFFLFCLLFFNIKLKFKEEENSQFNKFHLKNFYISFALVSTLNIYLISQVITIQTQKNKNTFFMNHVNLFPSFYFQKLGMLSYYLTEANESLTNNSPTVKDIKSFMNNCSYIPENFVSGQLEGANVIVILLETGDEWMLNEYTTPNLWKMLNDGLFCSNSYSHNHTNVSENISINGNVPSYDINMKNNFPSTDFNLPHILSNNKYHSIYAHDIVKTTDIYNRMNFMPSLGFEKCLWHDELDPNNIPWTFSNEDYSMDSLIMDSLKDKIVNFAEEFHNNEPFYLHFSTVGMHMNHNKKNNNAYRINELESLYREKLFQLELEGKWINPAIKNVDKNLFKYFTYRAMDFDVGLGKLMNTLYETDSDYLKNTLLVVFGDHSWYELLNSSFCSINKFVRNIDQSVFNDLNAYRTLYGFYHPKLNQLLPDHKFDKITWPTTIVPTILNLLGIPYNPRFYQGKSLFQDDYTYDEVFYSLWIGHFLNEHYDSRNGISITDIINDNGSQKKFLINLNYAMRQLIMIESIYKDNIFSKYNIDDFMPTKKINFI